MAAEIASARANFQSGTREAPERKKTGARRTGVCRPTTMVRKPCLAKCCRSFSCRAVEGLREGVRHHRMTERDGMLDAVTKGFKAAKTKLTGKAELTGASIDDALRDIRVALLEADVEFNVAKRFLARVKEKALGQVVQVSVADKKGKRLEAAPGDHFIKICHDELEALMGPVDVSLQLSRKGERPAGIMMVGLQGSGKTTTVAKLALLLQKRGKKPLLVAADIYRPAAVEQLQQLGAKLEIPVFYEENTKPPEMAQHALAYAGSNSRDVIRYDTARRLAIAEEMPPERRHRRSDEGFRGRRRREEGRGGCGEDPLRTVRPSRLRRADQAGQEDGQRQRAAGEVSALRRAARGRDVRRQGTAPGRGDHRLDDGDGAEEPVDHR